MGDQQFNDINRQLNKIEGELPKQLTHSQNKFTNAQNPTDLSDLWLVALISYHSTLENCLRASLVQVVPDDRKVAILDNKITDWKILRELGQQYSLFTYNDAEMISEANSLRVQFAHNIQDNNNVGNIRWDNNKFLAYFSFVNSICKSEINKWQNNGNGYSHIEPPKDIFHPPYSQEVPWYRSNVFLWISFFIFTPLWAFIMVTDKNRGCALRAFCLILLIAYTIICLVWIFNLISLIPYPNN